MSKKRTERPKLRIVPATNPLRPPAHLGEAGRAAWRELTDLFGPVTKANRPTLAALAEEWGRFYVAWCSLMEGYWLLGERGRFRTNPAVAQLKASLNVLPDLFEHLDDYGSFLAAKGNTTQHVNLTVSRCRAVLDGCHAEQFGDLRPSAVVEFLASLATPSRVVKEPPAEMETLTSAELADALGVRKDKLARILRRANLYGERRQVRRYPRAVFDALKERFARGTEVVSRNHYLTAVKGFTRWLMRDARTPLDPLVCLSRQNAAADMRHVRRILEAEEFSILLDAARRGRPIRGLTGGERAALYLLAARSGLRASELASLTWSSFDFAEPSVTVEAGYSKHRRKDVQPLPIDVAEELQRFCAGKAKGAPLWPGTWPEVGADILRLDLAAAGIPYADDGGNVYDFHALRHQFITDMVTSGVHPKDAQALARHSTITLTMDRYAHVRKSDLRTALDRLPSLQTESKGNTEQARRG